MPPTPVKPPPPSLSTWLAAQLKELAERARIAAGEEFSNGNDAAASNWRNVRIEILELAGRLPETTLPVPQGQPQKR